MRKQQTWLGDLWHKVFKSGNPLFLLIGLNVLVFLGLKVLVLVQLVVGNQLSLKDMILPYLHLPAAYLSAAWKPWTLLTYQFIHEDFFHILFNLLWLYWMGQLFLSYLKKSQFLFVYLIGGVVGGLLFIFSSWVFSDNAQLEIGYGLIGASAGVSAIVFAIATLLPNNTIQLLFLGNVPLKYLALGFLVLDLIGITGLNAGGSIAHIGGALWGFLYIRRLQNGSDLSKIWPLFRKKKLKVVRNTNPSTGKDSSTPDQVTIDRILDKISKSGYDGLTKAEKEALFKVSHPKKPHESSSEK